MKTKKIEIVKQISNSHPIGEVVDVEVNDAGVIVDSFWRRMMMPDVGIGKWVVTKQPSKKKDKVVLSQENE